MAGNTKLGYGFDLNFNAGKVSDTSYLGDYVYNEESDFNSEISLGKTIVGKQQFFDGDLSYLRKKEPANSLNEYYSLSGSYVKGVSPVNFPGRLELSTYLSSSVNVNDNNSVSRPPSSAQIGINIVGEIYCSFLLSTELFSHINSFVNSLILAQQMKKFYSNMEL